VLGGGVGGPTVIGASTNVSSVALTPRAAASVVGRALCWASVCDAPSDWAEPSLTMRTLASTASTALLSSESSPRLTLSSAARALELTVGALSAASAVVLTASCTMKAVALSSRRPVALSVVRFANTRHASGACAQSVRSRASAMRATLTPAGTVDDTVEMITRVTSTVPPTASPLPPIWAVAAECTVVASERALTVAATSGGMATIDSVAYETGE